MYHNNNNRYNRRKKFSHFTKGNGEVFLDSCDNNLEKAIRKLKRQLKNEMIMETVRMRSFYEKPSVKRRRKKAQSVWRTKNNKK